MNIQQIKYILAVAEHRHFETAAEKCFVTQSTLSTMISRFEDEKGIKIFDRKRKPVKITREGEELIEQFKRIQQEIEQLDHLVDEIKGEVSGELHIAAIPTIAPFILPLFMQSFAQKFPALNITVREQHTEGIIRQLKERELDIGILSTPLNDPDLLEFDLYNEPFVLYNAGVSENETVTAQGLDVSNLCLLEEGHCMRTQVLKLCDLHKKHLKQRLNFDFRAGSIDSLLRFVKANQASTLLPYLSTLEFNDNERSHIATFEDPVPYRKVGMIVHNHFARQQVQEELKQTILEKVEGLLPADQAKLGWALEPV
jgi:LysR family hydrogen peroxide-inducible transcriptional activator